MDEGPHLVLETRRRSEKEKEDQKHARLKAEEEACLVEKSRLEYEEEDLRTKAEVEACLVEYARLKYEKYERACLKAEEETHIEEDARHDAKEHDHAQLKV